MTTRDWRIRKAVEGVVFFVLCLFNVYWLRTTEETWEKTAALFFVFWWFWRIKDTWEGFWDGPDKKAK